MRGPTAREGLGLGKEGVDIMKRIGEEREAAMERQGTKGRPKDWWLGDDEQMEAEEKGKEDGGDEEEDGDDGRVLLAGFESPVMMSPVASGQIDEEMEGPEALES